MRKNSKEAKRVTTELSPAKEVLQRKVQRVEKALISLGKTKGSFPRQEINLIGERLLGKVAEVISKLNTPEHEDLFSFDRMYVDRLGGPSPVSPSVSPQPTTEQPTTEE